MSAECFLDSNVLVYAATGTDAERDKREKAQALIAAGDFGISAQVLQEFYVTVTRKARVPMSAVLAEEWLDQLDSYPCVAIDAALVKLGIAFSVRYRLSYWDGAIVAAAETLGARVIYTEDLGHGQVYGTVRCENPFER